MHLVHVKTTKKIFLASLTTHSSFTKMLTLLEAMVQPKSLRERGHVNLIHTPVEKSDAWNTQKDKTGVFIGVLTNVHHKCCAHDPLLNNIDCMMRWAPLEFSSTPPGWCFVTNVEILKKTERFNIDKMTLIQLMHPKYQTNNKNMDRKILVNAKICNEVTEVQYGSKKT